jgi:regulation of enolase protein 1 (concanavalin A-like superfamily)
MLDKCKWLNEPAEWGVSAAGLRVVTDRATDFWRQTHYGFTRHSGHLFGYTTSAGFTASVRIRATYERLYDQAGLMVLVDEENWTKAGVELSDGETMLSSVVTVGRSDWATGRFHGDASDFWMRMTIDDGVMRIQYSVDGKRWPLVRLCPFPAAAHYVVGPMCCTPERQGLSVLFLDFTVGPPNGKELHDLT